jgi:hypothetical protein
MNKDDLEKYRDMMYQATSLSDLAYMLDNKVNIITYDKLNDYNTFDEVIAPYQAAIILYPNYNDPNIGHWVCIFIMPGQNICQYFDSYGCYIDSPIGKFNTKVKEENEDEDDESEEEKEKLIHPRQRIEPKLLELLSESPYAENTWWNETAFQSTDKATATCGLWCVSRIKNNHLTEDEYRKLAFDRPINMNLLPDLVVTAAICKNYPEIYKIK